MEKSLLKETGRLHNLVCRRMRLNGEDGPRGMKLRGFVLGFLARSGGSAIQRDIERELNVRGSTVAVVLSGMENDGLIVRESVSEDRRLKRISLTAKAQRMTDDWFSFVTSMEKDLLDGVSETDLDIFYKVLNTICFNLEAIND